MSPPAARAAAAAAAAGAGRCCWGLLRLRLLLLLLLPCLLRLRRKPAWAVWLQDKETQPVAMPAHTPGWAGSVVVLFWHVRPIGVLTTGGPQRQEVAQLREELFRLCCGCRGCCHGCKCCCCCNCHCDCCGAPTALPHEINTCQSTQGTPSISMHMLVGTAVTSAMNRI